MKKISVILLVSSIFLFAACHNEGSSTVGIYENDEPAQTQERTEGHESEIKKARNEEAEPLVKEHEDTATAMPEGVMKTDTTKH